MAFRKVLFRALFPAVIVVPLLLLILRSLLFTETAGDVVLLLVLAPVLAMTMGVVAFLIWSRKSVRSSRAVSHLDAGVLAALVASVLVAGLVEHPATVVLVVATALGAFWAALWQLIAETRQRVRTAVDEFQAAAVSAESRMRRGPGSPSPERPHAGRVIRVDPPAE